MMFSGLMGMFLPLEFTLIRLLQGTGDWMTLPMRGFSFLGNVEFYALMVGALYWWWDARLGWRTALLLLLSGGINSTLKVLFQAPRPYWVSEGVQALSCKSTFSFPSGHAQNSAGIWGLLAHASHRRWAWPVAFLLALCIGLSRLYLGVHFLTDVVAGWLVGGLILWVFLRCEKPVGSWLKHQSIRARILMAFFGSLMMLLLAFSSRAVLGAWEMPHLWQETMMSQTGHVGDPLDVDTMLQMAGMLFGLGGGTAWLSGRWEYAGRGILRQRIWRCLVGACGVLLIWGGLGVLLPRGNTLLAYLARYLQYSLVGAWVSAGTPFLSLYLRQQFLEWIVA